MLAATRGGGGLVIVLVALIVAAQLSTAASSIEKVLPTACSSIFRPSSRYNYGYDTNESGVEMEDLVVFLGSAANIPHVLSTRGLVPMTSMWTKFTDVLYITKCDQLSSSGRHYDGRSPDDNSTIPEIIVQYLTDWMENESLNRSKGFLRKVYLVGNYMGSGLGSHVLDVVNLLLSEEDKKHSSEGGESCKGKGNSGDVAERGCDIGGRVSLSIRDRTRFAGVLLGNALFTPSVQFVAHRSFESGNGMSDWTLDRAMQPVRCNVFLSQVEFVMNDVRLFYTPLTGATVAKAKAKTATNNVNIEQQQLQETVEYALTGVSTSDMCYESVEAFVNALPYRYVPQPPSDPMWAALPLHSETVGQGKGEEKNGECVDSSSRLVDQRPFPCRDSGAYLQGFIEKEKNDKNNNCRSTSVSDIVQALLRRSKRVVLWSDIWKNPEPICSFYIGIYTGQAARFPLLQLSGTGAIPDNLECYNMHLNYDISSLNLLELYKTFNAAAWEELESGDIISSSSSSRRGRERGVFVEGTTPLGWSQIGVAGETSTTGTNVNSFTAHEDYIYLGTDEEGQRAQQQPQNGKRNEKIDKGEGGKTGHLSWLMLDSRSSYSTATLNTGRRTTSGTSNDNPRSVPPSLAMSERLAARILALLVGIEEEELVELYT